ncbi:MAG: hypothetical protein KJ838_00165 [Candidatus Omnitrophica bacterium]|nr:hypothetical protein [Candidatus Omnitrophota bacterium]
MMRIYFLILALFILGGCACAAFTVNNGKARFAIPFNFPGPETEETSSQQNTSETASVPLQLPAN